MMSNLDRPRALHPSSLLFLVMAHGRQRLVPLVFGIWSGFKGSWTGILLAGGIGGLLVLFALVHYFTFRYRIADGELVVTEGLVSRKVRNVPVDRIQNVDLVQNLFHRLLGVAEVRVETASGTEPEAILRVLSLDDVAKLRQQILGRSLGATDQHDSTHANTQPRGEVLLTIPTSWLVKAGLASSRGLVIVGILLGYFFQRDFDEDFDAENAKFQWLADWMPEGSNWILMLVGGVSALAVIRLLGVAWYVLRFHGYQLQRVAEDLHISCGLLTKVSATVPRRRIQFISVHQSPLLRWMKLSSIRIETAGGAGKQDEDAAATVTRRWFVPIIPNEQVEPLLEQLRPGFSWHNAAQAWSPLSPRAGQRMKRISIISGIILMIVGLVVARPWGWIPGLLAIPIFLWWSKLHLRQLGYARFDQGVLFRSGVWTRKTSVTFFDRIQTMTFSESPFDRRWGMASLQIDTAAAGPADHSIDISLLEANHVKDELAIISQRCAAAGMRWN
jgi:putative membrane protein